MGTDEVYPNAPLALVVVEIRHAHAPITNAIIDAIRLALEDTVPLPRVENTFGLNVTSQGATQRQNRSVRFMSRDSHSSVSVRDEAIVVETTDYPGWDDFSDLVLRAVTAREDISSPASVDRVGVRFINEVRAPIDPDRGWADWVSTTLLGPDQLAKQLGRSLTSSQGGAVFEAVDRSNTQVVNYGASIGQAVESQPNLRRLRDESGPFFLIDIDSSWLAGADGDIPSFDREMISSTLEQLHEPIDSIFESLITDKLRTEVLRVRRH